MKDARCHGKSRLLLPPFPHAINHKQSHALHLFSHLCSPPSQAVLAPRYSVSVSLVVATIFFLESCADEAPSEGLRKPKSATASYSSLAVCFLPLLKKMGGGAGRWLMTSTAKRVSRMVGRGQGVYSKSTQFSASKSRRSMSGTRHMPMPMK